MPDKFDGLAQNFADNVVRVVIAIRSGENDDTEFHSRLRAIENVCIAAAMWGRGYKNGTL
jgi:hypothetical protein